MKFVFKIMYELYLFLITNKYTRAFIYIFIFKCVITFKHMLYYKCMPGFKE